ncbi:MAG: ubiquinol-cytochrome c reductase iron-sulfur subunit [Gemmatimonadota bacterium]
MRHDRDDERDGGRTGRRDFLARATLAMGGVFAAAISGLGGAYVVGSRGRGSKDRFTSVARVDELRSGEPVRIDYVDVVPDAWTTIRRRRSVWLVRERDDRIVAFDPHCTHLGCPYDWNPSERLFRCPCHGGVFDIEGNVVAGPPPRPLDRLEQRVENGALWVGGLAAPPSRGPG